MKKFPSIPRLDQIDGLEEGDIVVQEKLDGANFRFTRQGDDIIFGSKNAEFIDEEGKPLPVEECNHQFQHAVEYVLDKVDADDLPRDCPVYFGEAMHKHTMSYDWESIPDFIGFNIYWEDDDRFAYPELAVGMFRDIGLASVPVSEKLTADEFYENYVTSEGIDREALIPEKEYGEGRAEGVVLVNHHEGEHNQVKIHSKEFREKEKTPNTPSKDNPTDTDKLVDTYCTEMRIKKTAHKFLDEGEWDDLQMEMMADLAPRVIDDIWEEEHTNIAYKNWTIDMADVRSKVSSRCASTLKDMMEKKFVAQ